VGRYVDHLPVISLGGVCKFRSDLIGRVLHLEIYRGLHPLTLTLATTIMKRRRKRCERRRKRIRRYLDLVDLGPEEVLRVGTIDTH